MSPIVVRKEFENIITIKNEKEKSVQNICIINEKFVNNHEIVFWNLVWYFKRIGVEILHLSVAIIKNRIITFKARNNLDQKYEFKLDEILKKKEEMEKPKLNIFCMWDNLKLHESQLSHEIPLYISFFKLNAKHEKNSHNKNISNIGYLHYLDEIYSIRGSTSTEKTLKQTIDHIIQQIKKNSDILSPIQTLLKERLCSRKNYLSVYREILFLILVSLERQCIDIDAFDSEYRKSFNNILIKTGKLDSLETILSSDKPPNNLAVWCRRLFSPLNI